PEYRETGAFVICSLGQAASGTRFGAKVSLSVVDKALAVDIDTYQDFALCEHVLTRKKIAFVVSGYAEIGMGHVYRTMMLADCLVNYDLFFLTDHRSELARGYIEKK